MRFSAKLFLSSMFLFTLAFSICGTLLISQHFQSTVERELDREIAEHQSLKFLLQSQLITSKLEGKNLTSEVLTSGCEKVSQSSGRLFSVMQDESVPIFSNIPSSHSIPTSLFVRSTTERKHAFLQEGEEKYCWISSAFALEDQTYYFLSLQNSTEIFDDLDRQIRTYTFAECFAILCCAGLLLILSRLLTRPIHQLAIASRQIADGAYSDRVIVKSRDEIGELAENFNSMADAVQEKIQALELAAQQKEDFVANFAHELKTPLTSIIGYADLLRSRDCDEDTRFQALSYIFSEGKRLESLSLKLLDLIVMNNQSFSMSPAYTIPLFEEIAGAVYPALAQAKIMLELHIAPQLILVEKDLFKTLMINLIDNARKASPPGSRIEIFGGEKEGQYEICVQDHGIGIPKEDLQRITEAFYMVDKSRSRKQHGAGLGLAICERIAQLHQTVLRFESAPGEGTRVFLSLVPVAKEEKNEEV